MSIPSQFPQMVSAARTGALQALALQAGQMVDARVVGAAPNGGTQVEIRGQMLNLLLPIAVTPGQALTFEVQGSGAQLRLALQAGPATTPPPVAPSTPPPATILPPAAPVVPGTSPTPPLPATPLPQAAPSATPPPVLPPAATPQAPVTAMPAATPQPAGTAAPQLPTTPYPVAQAATAALNPAATAAAATAAIQPPQPQPGLSNTVQPIAPAPPAAGVSARPAPPMPATPQAALAQMVQASVPLQGRVTDLTAALASLAGKVALPEPVMRAAQQVLAGRLSLDGARFDGQTLQTALRQSGLFQEAALARGQVPLPQADMKSALLALRQTLVTWLGQQAPVAAVSHVAPPLKGSAPRAPLGTAAPPLDPEAPPETIGRHLLERTDSALARIRLHQHASLPDAVGRNADWSMDLPVLVGTQQSLMHIHIHRDQQGEGAEAGERGWQLRFALNLPELGEVGAQVSLRGGATGVMLWAAEAETAALLEAELSQLRDGLAGAGLQPGAVIVRHGVPPAPPQAPSGRFVDART